MLIAAHFGARVPASALVTTTVDLASPGRTATLVMRANAASTLEARPLLVVADDGGNHVLWSRERPIAGIMPPVGPIALAGAPSDRVALAACDPPTRVVALRIFDYDGAPFADLQAMSNETCDAISLTYWPKHGWIIVIAREGATRAQLVKESGSSAWPDGIDVGVKSRPKALAAPSVVVDTSDTFLLTQLAEPNGEDTVARHALVFRYDAEGTPIWPKATAIPLKKPAAAPIAVMRKVYNGVEVLLPDGSSALVKPSGAFETMK